MHVEDLRTAITKLGPCLTQLYGMGETPMTITYLPQKDHIAEGTPDQLKRLASAGIPRTGVDVQVVTPQDAEAPFGQMGEFVVRSDVVMRGYWNDPASTAETLRHGWLHTGDVGRFDEEGHLYIVDRKRGHHHHIGREKHLSF